MTDTDVVIQRDVTHRGDQRVVNQALWSNESWFSIRENELDVRRLQQPNIFFYYICPMCLSVERTA